MCLFTLPVCLFADSEDTQTIVAKSPPIVNLGSLQASALVVDNLEAALSMWSAGTGAEFSPVTTDDCVVFLSSGGPTHVTIRSAYSVYSDPFIELVEANPPVGPWAPQVDSNNAVGYQVYAVSNIHQVDATMVNAGLTKIAFSGNKFAFYKAANGLLIKVINEKLLPPSGGTNIPQAPIDIGPVKHTDVAVRDQDTLKTQFSTLFSINWTDFAFTDNPITFPEGTVLVDVNVAVSDAIPQIQLEKITPPLTVFNSTLTTYDFHPAYVVPAGTMDAVRAQMEAAGFTLNTYVTLPGFGLVLSYYSGLEKIFIEIVDARFDF